MLESAHSAPVGQETCRPVPTGPVSRFDGRGFCHCSCRRRDRKGKVGATNLGSSNLRCTDSRHRCGKRAAPRSLKLEDSLCCGASRPFWGERRVAFQGTTGQPTAMSQGGNSAVKDNDRGFSHILLDVYSIKQGALRIAVIPTASLLCLFVGLYLATSAVLNYNAEDSDQRDMITNMRLVLPARQAAHDKSQVHSRSRHVTPQASVRDGARCVQSETLVLWCVGEPTDSPSCRRAYANLERWRLGRAASGFPSRECTNRGQSCRTRACCATQRCCIQSSSCATERSRGPTTRRPTRQWCAVCKPSPLPPALQPTAASPGAARPTVCGCRCFLRSRGTRS